MVTKFQNPIQEYLQEVETRMRARFNGHTSGLINVLDQLVSLGGKRVRPTLTILVGKMLGANLDQLLDLAAAIEMLHTATLIHDDLVDDASLRRGAKTINASWPPAASVLAGDLVFAIAANLAADTKSVSVMELFAETLAIIVNGEITYLFDDRSDFDQEKYYRWIYAKTASMFELATGAAALLSSADEEEIYSAREFGRQIGMAFQIVDDVLDFTGAQTEIGKPVGNDLRQGTITLPTLYYYKDFPDDPDILSVINRNGHDEHSLNRLISAISQSEAIEKSIREAHRFVELGLDALYELPEAPEQHALADLTRYIIDRKS